MPKTLKKGNRAAPRRDESDLDVPPSERGKGENMTLDQRSPSSIFGLVALSYMLVLVLALLVLAIWLWL